MMNEKDVDSSVLVPAFIALLGLYFRLQLAPR